MKNTKLKVLSWGCGVQSTTLAVMSTLGELEKLDAIIFSDTHNERKTTYQIKDFYSQWLRKRDMAVYTVSNGDILQLGAKEHIHIPFWTSDGGPLRRQCTRHFKIQPVKWQIRELLGFDRSRAPHPKPGSVELWLGISLDEWTRMKDSRVRFINHRWPLIENGVTRNDCIEYLKNLDLPVPDKSACKICPYRQASEWLEMRESSPDEWQEAVKFDEVNRDNPLAERGGSTADYLYIYKGGIPLAQANLVADAKRQRQGKQLPMINLVCEPGFCNS